MQKKILALIACAMIATIPTINCSAVSYVDSADLSASDSNTIRLFNYAKNDDLSKVYFAFKDCIAFSTDSTHSYLIFGDIFYSNGVYSSANAIVYKLVRSAGGGVSVSKSTDNNFSLLSSHLLLGSLPTVQQFNGYSDFLFQSESLVFMLLLFLAVGFSMFLNIRRS